VSHQRVIVPIGKTVAPVFAPDHRAVAVDAAGDFGEAQPSVEAPHDLHALFKTHPMSRSAGPVRIMGRGQPAQAAISLA
jgi:hypothetical protein